MLDWILKIVLAYASWEGQQFVRFMGRLTPWERRKRESSPSGRFPWQQRLQSQTQRSLRASEPALAQVMRQVVGLPDPNDWQTQGVARGLV